MLPESLKDGTFANDLKSDPATKKWLTSLLALLAPTDGPAA